MTADALGDRMKAYESAEAQRRFIPLLPIVVRLDGRCFSSYTRSLRAPFDERFHRVMVRVTSALVSDSNARVGYTQSDEITLVLYVDDPKTEPFFGGRVQKITSVLAAHATYVLHMWVSNIPELVGLATFDCRAWNVPTLEEAANAVLWRELDATKNSISSAARCYYSHQALHKKKGAEMQEMLWQKGVNWNDYQVGFKRGTYVRRVSVSGAFSPEELAALPEKHAARLNPALTFERSVVSEVEMPPLSQVVNRVGALFCGETPRLKEPAK